MADLQGGSWVSLFRESPCPKSYCHAERSGPIWSAAACRRFYGCMRHRQSAIHPRPAQEGVAPPRNLTKRLPARPPRFSHAERSGTIFSSAPLYGASRRKVEGSLCRLSLLCELCALCVLCVSLSLSWFLLRTPKLGSLLLTVNFELSTVNFLSPHPNSRTTPSSIFLAPRMHPRPSRCILIDCA